MPDNRDVLPVLVDASALVALLDRDDAQHDRAVETFKQIHNPLTTVWPALTEAMHLVAETHRGPDALCDMVTDGALKLLLVEAPDFARIKELMGKYRDLPMDFADAALVRAAERDGLTRIVTFDDHFTVYRLGHPIAADRAGGPGFPRRTKFTVLPRPG